MYRHKQCNGELVHIKNYWVCSRCKFIIAKENKDVRFKQNKKRDKITPYAKGIF